jgi:Mg2+/Co2+ transporter CorB
VEDISLGTCFGLIVCAVIASAFCVAAETGVMMANRYRLRQLARTGDKGARRILGLLARPDRFVGLMLVLITTANTVAAALAALAGWRLGGSVGVALATGALVLTLVLVAEVGPKRLAAQQPETAARAAAFVLPALLKLLTPLLWLVNITSNVLFRLSPLAKGGPRQLGEELRALGEDVFAAGQHRGMLLAVLELDRITVDDIMIPRGEVEGIDIEADIDTIVRQLRRTHHTRLPVYRGELNNCVGILHVRNATRFLGKPELTRAEILQYVREPYFVPEGTTLPAQLLQFQKLKRRFGLVVDEYGDVQGIVTLEAILEEIVGEFTTRIGDSHRDMRPQPDGSWLIDGACSVRDINRMLQWDLPVDGPKTLNGLILEVLETIPESPLSLRLGDYCIEVLQIRDNAVRSARVIPPGDDK